MALFILGLKTSNKFWRKTITKLFLNLLLLLLLLLLLFFIIIFIIVIIYNSYL